MIKILKNKNELLRIIEKYDNLVVDFYAHWCQPCQIQGPILEKVSKTISNFHFFKINVEQLNNECCAEMNIVSIPTIIIFRKNNEIKRFVGLTDKVTLIKSLKKCI